MSERRGEYLDIAPMLRELRSLNPQSREYQRLRETIVSRTLPLTEHIALRFRGRGQSHDDLCQVGCVGLLNAINRFDPEKGDDFLSFAVPTILGEVRRYFRDSGWVMKVPRGIKDLTVKLPAAHEELSRQLHRSPTASELATHLGVDREAVVQATIASNHYSTLSTDTSHSSDDEVLTLKDRLGDVDSRLDQVIDSETVRPLIQQLPEREQAVLRMRFFEEMTQTQIAERIGCSQMHVSRILAHALASIRNCAAAHDLTPQQPSSEHGHPGAA